MLTERLRNRIACYAAAITIILQQLNSQPDTAVTETPTPLVRVRHSFGGELTWHPDELLANRSGGQCVLVWGTPDGDPAEMTSSPILSN